MGAFTAYRCRLVDLLPGAEILPKKICGSFVHLYVYQYCFGSIGSFYPVLIMIPVGLYSLHCFDTTYFAISNDRKEHARI